MRIYKMTATFGKLEHETLTLEPGLNIIQAPNEWGKSTWCAFLVAMLYGMETRVKSTKTTLADKERYAPWSGSPMAGRMDIAWRGRDITIERRTKGRIPMGQFSAYETESGLPVPELTAANCGEMLLGVERSVFLRSGFIRFSDLPVTQDEALRRRLNALVTTGDESGDGERLQKGLRDLKNKVRYNRSGLLPQAEAEQSELEGKLRELDALDSQSQKLTERTGQVKTWIARLENHKEHLRYQAALADQARVAKAEENHKAMQRRLLDAQSRCVELPSREEGEEKLSQMRKLSAAAMDLQTEERTAAQPPVPPEAPEGFQGMDGDEAMEQAREDRIRYEILHAKRSRAILGALLLIVGCGLAMWYRMAGIICAAAGVAVFAIDTINQRRKKNELKTLFTRYGTEDPAQWLEAAQKWDETLREYTRASEAYQRLYGERVRRAQALREETAAAAGNLGLEEARSYWEQVIDAWDTLADAKQDHARSQGYVDTLHAMVKAVQPPEKPDELTYPEADTAKMLSDAYAEQNQLHSRLSQYQGRMEALGDRETIGRELERVRGRIGKLEETYGALVLAQQTLTDATQSLQRRFAPKIAKRAQEIMGAFTSGRYDRLTLGEDLGLRAGAEEEDILHEALWRSDGTVDQLYLSLRLAVAEALTQEAPLILDDALVRFDDARLKAALGVLEEMAGDKQVILFTCHDREKRSRIG